MRTVIISLICSVLISVPVSARRQPQAAPASGNRDVKVHIEGKEVDALELLQQLNAHGEKKHLNFIEKKEGFDYKVNVDTVATTRVLQKGFVGANVVVENNKGESLFFFRAKGEIYRETGAG